MVNPAAVQDKKKKRERERKAKKKGKEEKKKRKEEKKKEVGLTLLVGLLRAVYSQALSHY